jgi:hypothetical protein
MVSCKIVDVFYAAIPLSPVRNLLIRRHAERCARCRARLISREEAAALFVQPRDMASACDLWPKIESAVGRPVRVPAERPAASRWEWAVAAATALFFAAAGLWLLRGVRSEPLSVELLRPADRFEINYINVGGEPAQAFIYQPQGSDMIIVWAEKTP